MEQIKFFANGKYQVLAKIAEGGFSEIYLVRETTHGLIRVLKTPKPGTMARREDFYTRFSNEAAIPSCFPHPYAVTVYESGVELTRIGNRVIQQPYIILDYIEGRDLKVCMEEFGPIPPRAACKIMLQMLSVLAAMHKHRIVHRDFKPNNIMLRLDGIAVLFDFGAAQVHTETAENNSVVSGVTVAGIVIGTHGFMPLEQLSWKELDARTDLFAVGTALFNILTGLDPNQVSMWLLDESHERMEAVPVPLRKVIIGATRPQKEDRAYRDADEMAVAIEMAMEELPKDDRSRDFYLWLKSKGYETKDAGQEPGLVRDPTPSVVPVEDRQHAASVMAQNWFVDEEEAGESADEPASPPAAIPRAQRPATVLTIAGMAVLIGIAFIFGLPKLKNDTPPTIMPPTAAAALVSETKPEPKPAAKRTEVAPTNTPPAAPAKSKAKTKRPGGQPAKTPATVAIAPALESAKSVPLVKTGTLRVIGPHKEVRLVSSRGTYGPGDVPIGSYRLEALFEGSTEFAEFQSVQIKDGETLTVVCNAFNACAPQ